MINLDDVLKMATAGQQDAPRPVIPNVVPRGIGQLGPDKIVAACLASGIISASGKPHTVEEAVGVFKEVRRVMEG